MTTHKNPTASDRGRTGREIALNVGAIAGLICVLAAAASFFFGIKPLIFRSGSMSPDITTGSLALSHTVPAADLAVDDVVSVLNEQGTRITHRVTEIVSSGADTSVLILKGDANKDADISPYTVTEADRVFFSLPGLGYAVAWLSSPIAIFLGGAFVGGLMVIAFRPTGRKDDDDPSTGGTPGAHEAAEPEPNLVAHGGFEEAPTQQFEMPVQHSTSLRSFLPARSLMVFGAVGLTAFGATAVGTTAAFTDTSVAASSFSSGNFYPTPLVSTVNCNNSGTAGFRDAVISWPSLGNTPLGTPYKYKVIVRRDNNPSEIVQTNDDVTGTSISFNGGYYGRGYIAEVHTKNGTNVSTGWKGQGIWVATPQDTYCSGGFQPGVANPASENLTSGVETMSMRMAAGAMPSAEAAASTSANTVPTTTTSAAQSATTTTAPTATTTAPSTTTTAQSSTTTTVPTATAPPATTTSEPSKATTTAPFTTTTAPSTTTTTASAMTTTAEAIAVAAAGPVQSGDLAIANKSPSGTYAAQVSSGEAVITDKSGSTVFNTPVGTTAVVQWAASSDQLWIIDSGALYRVESAGWTKTKVDPKSGDVPAEISALVK